MSEEIYVDDKYVTSCARRLKRLNEWECCKMLKLVWPTVTHCLLDVIQILLAVWNGTTNNYFHCQLSFWSNNNRWIVCAIQRQNIVKNSHHKFREHEVAFSAAYIVQSIIQNPKIFSWQWHKTINKGVWKQQMFGGFLVSLTCYQNDCCLIMHRSTNQLIDYHLNTFSQIK